MTWESTKKLIKPNRKSWNAQQLHWRWSFTTISFRRLIFTNHGCMCQNYSGGTQGLRLPCPWCFYAWSSSASYEEAEVFSRVPYPKYPISRVPYEKRARVPSTLATVPPAVKFRLCLSFLWRVETHFLDRFSPTELESWLLFVEEEWLQRCRMWIRSEKLSSHQAGF